ncbi:hypothetical protein NIES4106_59450 (plasmid) [Fischerella sp. NIES-4106]|nr:hypothetical protein NIES4106_31780 [Fischerella sp. NIES-4106]BAZ70888.1 hypothetical protein NIES4106_56850 [Fischerella sp. NIES-4106]BAZ71147.1 hypothetical protein NIES4106_59440 [Fischerella sp. NIES-4106]BAZ71148.1 hypothetical protein NIES4106_59450 [Fischerella sp. NIES-4106]
MFPAKVDWQVGGSDQMLHDAGMAQEAKAQPKLTGNA